jgi:hypothetical protein
MRLPSAVVVSNAISAKPGYRLARALNTFDFEAVQAVSKAQVMALASGDAWLNNGANLLLFEVAPFQWTVCQLAVYLLVMAARMSAS